MKISVDTQLYNEDIVPGFVDSYETMFNAQQGLNNRNDRVCTSIVKEDH